MIINPVYVQRVLTKTDINHTGAIGGQLNEQRSKRSATCERALANAQDYVEEKCREGYVKVVVPVGFWVDKCGKLCTTYNSTDPVVHPTIDGKPWTSTCRVPVDMSPDDEQFPAAQCQHHRSSKTPNQFSEMYSSYYASGVLCNSVDGESSDEDGLFDLQINHI